MVVEAGLANHSDDELVDEQRMIIRAVAEKAT